MDPKHMPQVYTHTFSALAPTPSGTIRKGQTFLDSTVTFLSLRLPYALPLQRRLTLWPKTAHTILLSTHDFSDNLAPANAFAIACWDRTGHPGPECFFFTSLDSPTRPFTSPLTKLPDSATPEECQAVLPHILAIFSALQSSSHYHTPGISALNPATKVTLASRCLIGALSIRNLETLTTLAPHVFPAQADPGRLRSGAVYPKLAFRVPAPEQRNKNATRGATGMLDRSSSPRPTDFQADDETFVTGLSLHFSHITPADDERIAAHNDIIRLVGVGYLRNAPNAALRTAEGELVAWVLLRSDGSLGALTVMPSWRGKGLAGVVVRRVITLGVEEWMEGTGGDGMWKWDGWAHSDVSRENTASWAVFERMGAREVDVGAWVHVDLGVNACTGVRLGEME